MQVRSMISLEDLTAAGMKAGLIMHDSGPVTLAVDAMGYATVPPGYEELHRLGLATLTYRGTSQTYALTEAASIAFDHADRKTENP